MNEKLQIVFFFCLIVFFTTENLYAQEKIQISGKVVDKLNNPLPGATITIKEDQLTGTITDRDGRFSLKTLSNSVVIVSYLGYTSQALRASEIIDATITLEESAKDLEEVVVIGYGVVRKKDLTGAVSVVKTEDLQNIPMARVDQMLQGRIAGVDVMSTGGEPGANTSIRIRGSRSITASNDPLYVIDGVLDGTVNISDLNPSDIESIEVLKDASATAIYGSRAANGVIIITTKVGKEGKTQFTAKADIGFSELPQMLDIMNATEFALFYNDYKSLPGVIYSTNSYKGSPTKTLEELAYPDPFSLGKGTNWVEEVTRVAPYQNYLFSGNGGSKNTQYYFSLNFNDTQGIIKNSGEKRIQGRINLTQRFSSKLTAGARINYSYIHTEKNTVEIGTVNNAAVNAALSLAPIMPVYKEDGSYNDWNPIRAGVGAYVDSPVALADLAKHDLFDKSLSSSFYVDYRPFKYLILKSSVSYQDYSRNEERLLPSTLPTRRQNKQGAYALQRIYTNSNILNENTITYKNTIRKSQIDALYGFTYQRRENKMLSANGSGYTNDITALWTLQSVPNKQNFNVSSNLTDRITLSHLSRFSYNYDNRYYLTVTGRMDGSSNFAKNNKWAFFPSAAVKWNIMNESFMKGLNNHISNSAIRLSYGVTGNQAIAAYASLGKMSPWVNGYIFNDAIPGSYYQEAVPNPSLTWEKTSSYNIGFDFSILRSRITFTLDYYDSRTRDLLLEVQVPQHTGYSTRLENVGKTANKGYEITVNSTNINIKRFKWITTLTMSHNQQVVLDAGGYDRIPTYTPNVYTYEMYGYQQGYPVNALWGMEYAGVWKSREEIEENKTTKKYASKTMTYTDLGRQKYIDQNNDGVLDRNDIVYLGSSDPLISGGFQNNFQIYGISLNIYFNYSLGGYIFNPLELNMGSGDYQTNQFRYMTNAWHPVRNPNSDIPRANSKDYVVSTAQRHEASFLRLKDVSVAYTFNLAKQTKNKINTATISLSGNNLYLWKYYNGFDPEVSTLSTTRRVDVGAYPSSRTIVFSTQINF